MDTESKEREDDNLDPFHVLETDDIEDFWHNQAKVTSMHKYTIGESHMNHITHWPQNGLSELLSKLQPHWE